MGWVGAVTLDGRNGDRILGKSEISCVRRHFYNVCIQGALALGGALLSFSKGYNNDYRVGTKGHAPSPN